VTGYIHDESRPSGTGRYAAVITAAGAGTRMGGGPKKEYRTVRGKPVLAHTLTGLLGTGRFSLIVITLPQADLGLAGELLSRYAPLDRVLLTPGGSTRQESVRLGLSALERALRADPPTHVLIHDGARPWITPELVERVIKGTVRYGACLPVTPIVYAVKAVDRDGFVERHLDRSGLAAAQTPQGFEFRGILEAHRKAVDEGYLGYDDTELYGRYVGRVFTIPGDPANIKITYAQDLEVTP
jgi:2-C-methyl-D-erythritol 4-phosphate cytidylyltransferase